MSLVASSGPTVSFMARSKITDFITAIPMNRTEANQMHAKTPNSHSVVSEGRSRAAMRKLTTTVKIRAASRPMFVISSFTWHFSSSPGAMSPTMSQSQVIMALITFIFLRSVT